MKKKMKRQRERGREIIIYLIFKVKLICVSRYIRYIISHFCKYSKL